MFYVYILKSLRNKDIYVGYSDDLRQRYKDHNNRNVKSTKAYAPWKLIYYEAYRNKKDATRRERQLKMHKAKTDMKKQLEYSLLE